MCPLGILFSVFYRDTPHTEQQLQPWQSQTLKFNDIPIQYVLVINFRDFEVWLYIRMDNLMKIGFVAFHFTVVEGYKFSVCLLWMSWQRPVIIRVAFVIETVLRVKLGLLRLKQDIPVEYKLIFCYGFPGTSISYSHLFSSTTGYGVWPKYFLFSYPIPLTVINIRHGSTILRAQCISNRASENYFTD